MKKLATVLLATLCFFNVFAQGEDGYIVEVDTVANTVSYQIQHIGIGDNLCFDENLQKDIIHSIEQTYKRKSAIRLLLKYVDEPLIYDIKYVFFAVTQTWDGRVISLRIGIRSESMSQLLCEEACKNLLIEFEREHILPTWNDKPDKIAITFGVKKDEINEVLNSLKTENNDEEAQNRARTEK